MLSTVDLSVEDIAENVLAAAHDAVRDQSLPWRKDVTWNASQRSRFRGARTLLNASRRRCESDDASPDQAGEKFMSRCPMSDVINTVEVPQICTSTEQWTSRLRAGDGKRVTSESRLPRF